VCARRHDIMRPTAIHSQWSARRHDQRGDSRTPIQTNTYSCSQRSPPGETPDEAFLTGGSPGPSTAPMHQTRPYGHDRCPSQQRTMPRALLFSPHRDSECPAHHNNPPAVGSRPIISQIPALPHIQISNTLPPKTKYNYDRTQRPAVWDFRAINAHIQLLFITSPIILIHTAVHNKSNTPQSISSYWNWHCASCKRIISHHIHTLALIYEYPTQYPVHQTC
jgi:hypothetical protein